MQKERVTFNQLARRFWKTSDAAERMDLLEEAMLLQSANWNEVGFFLSDVLERDPDQIVRHEAAFNLGELRRREAIGDSPAERVLCHAARHDASIVVRHEAAEALYCFPGVNATQTLNALLMDAEDDIRATARISLKWRNGIL